MGVTTPDVTANPQLVTPTANVGLTVTPSNASFSNSAWFVFATSSAAAWTVLGMSIDEPITDVDYEFNIGTGASGAETLIATIGSHSPAVVTGSGWNMIETRIPVEKIPISTRVVTRMRKEGTSTTNWDVKLHYYNSVASTVGVTALPTQLAPAAAQGTPIGSPTLSYVNSEWRALHAGLTDIAALQLIVAPTAALSAADYEFDIGTGATGAETVVGTTGLSFRSVAGSRCIAPFCIPIKIAGTNRISARMRRNIIANPDTLEFKLQYVSTSDFNASSSLHVTTAIPAVTSNAASFPTVAGSNGSWTNSVWLELITSTATAIVLTSLTTNPPALVIEWEADLGMGASGAETVIGTFADMTHSNVGADNTLYFGVPIDVVPVSTRVAVRVRKNSTNTAAWAFGVGFTPKPL